MAHLECRDRFVRLPQALNEITVEHQANLLASFYFAMKRYIDYDSPRSCFFDCGAFLLKAFKRGILTRLLLYIQL